MYLYKEIVSLKQNKKYIKNIYKSCNLSYRYICNNYNL